MDIAKRLRLLGVMTGPQILSFLKKNVLRTTVADKHSYKTGAMEGYFLVYQKASKHFDRRFLRREQHCKLLQRQLNLGKNAVIDISSIINAGKSYQLVLGLV